MRVKVKRYIKILREREPHHPGGDVHEVEGEEGEREGGEREGERERKKKREKDAPSRRRC
jgi:hypothetical protein